MEVNRYDLPVNYEYVSQYVPIPFDQLYQMGLFYANERKQAEKELQDYLKRVGEFQSLINKDVDNYYRIALNDNVSARIKEASENPQVMRSASWRSGLQRALSDVDYASLSKLKKSAESADLYQKEYNRLASQGKMPPGWEKNYFDTYDTLAEDKIFNETPLAYQSINDLVDPYVDDLKSTFLGTRGGYDVNGVSKLMTRHQVDEHMSEILLHPVMQRHIQMLKNKGMSDLDALNAAINYAYTASEEKAHEALTPNPYALLKAKEEYDLAKERAKHKNEFGGNPLIGEEDMLTRDFNDKSRMIVGGVSQQDPRFSTKYQEAFQKNGEALNESINTLLASNADFKNNFDLAKNAYLLKGVDGNLAAMAAFTYAVQNTKSLKDDDLKDIAKIQNEALSIQDTMTQEAYGKFYQESFNQILGLSPESNPFESIKHSNAWFGSTEYFDDTKAQHMWAQALEGVYQPISSETEQMFNKKLFGKETSKDDKGFKINPQKMISPKEFIISTNDYIKSLADKAEFNVLGTKLDRGSIIENSDNNISLEERLSAGDYGDAKVTEIVGYIDSRNARNYVARVRIPIDEDDSSFGEAMTSTLRNDDLKGAISSAGYDVTPREGGGYDVTLLMVIPDTNKPIDKRRTNLKQQKDFGTSKTKESMIVENDIVLDNNVGYNPMEGFE